jgi:hypothetical protein
MRHAAARARCPASPSSLPRQQHAHRGRVVLDEVTAHVHGHLGISDRKPFSNGM